MSEVAHFVAFAIYVKTSCFALGVQPPHVEARPLAWDRSAEATTDGYGPIIYADTAKLGTENMERLAWHECAHLKLGHHELSLTPKQQHAEDFKALMAEYDSYKKRKKQ